MVELAQLTRPKIRRHVGDASLDKARSYLRDDVWSDLRAQGQTIGRLQVVGEEDEEPVWRKIATLAKLVQDFQRTAT